MSTFSRMHNKEQVQEEQQKQRARQCVQFESRITEHMLKRLKLSDYKYQLIDIFRRETGSSGLRLSAFNEKFSTFPFLFGVWCPAVAIHADPCSTEPARFKKFGDVPFVRAYQAFYDARAAEAAGRAMAMIFPRKGFAYGMVMHNYDNETFWENGSCWVYKHVKKKEVKFYVQPFSALLDGVYRNGHGWKP